MIFPAVSNTGIIGYKCKRPNKTKKVQNNDYNNYNIITLLKQTKIAFWPIITSSCDTASSVFV